MRAKLKHDRSEFNRPMCYMMPDGVCQQEIHGKTCETNEFEYCINGWNCHYFCNDMKHVYNSRLNTCQDSKLCQKTMRDDL